MFLSDSSIRTMINGAGSFSEYVDLDSQVQPNGFDLTLASISRLQGTGRIYKDDKVLPEYTDIAFQTIIFDGSEREAVMLAQGSYFIRFNETISVPINCLGLGRPRSTILRCGASIHTGVWDAGYVGKSGCLLVVHNNFGLFLEKDARVVQLVLASLDAIPEAIYQGSYQGEGLDQIESTAVEQVVTEDLI